MGNVKISILQNYRISFFYVPNNFFINRDRSAVNSLQNYFHFRLLTPSIFAYCNHRKAHNPRI